MRRTSVEAERGPRAPLPALSANASTAESSKSEQSFRLTSNSTGFIVVLPRTAETGIQPLCPLMGKERLKHACDGILHS